MRESIPHMHGWMDTTLCLQQDNTLHVLKCDNGDPDSRQMLQYEAACLHELRHPHIVNLYRVLKVRWPSVDSVALDMEHCELGDVKNARLSTTSLRKCFEQVLSALLYLHSQGGHTMSLNSATATMDMVQLLPLKLNTARQGCFSLLS